MNSDAIKKKNIAIIGSAYPLRGGGIATFNERLAKALKDDGHEVIIYTFSLQYPDFLFPGKSQYSEEDPPQELNIKVLINSINPVNWIKSGWYIRKTAPDIVIMRYWIPFMGPCLGTIARIIKTNKKSKVIAIVDNAIPHEKKLGDKAFSKYFFTGVDAYITMSKSVLKDLYIFDKKKPREFVPHPLYDNFGEIIPKDKAKELLGLNNQIHYILFFGFIREYKGLDILLKALSDERLKKLPVKLLIAGEFYTNPDKYFQIIKEYKLKDNVELRTEFIPNSDVHKYFCASDVVVQPYKSATQSGITQIAYYFNKPIITSNVGGLSEIVPDNIVGYVVNPESGLIADAINNFFTMQKENEFSINASKEKIKYSWNTFIQFIYKLADILDKK